MTHDELLAKIDDDNRWGYGRSVLALRAVVELCRQYGDDYYTEDFADLIIEAIKKELG